MLQRKKRGIMTYNPHAASKTHKQILTWTSLELTPLRGQCNTTSACEVMLTLAWHHRRANRSEANCWHWIYSQTSDGRSSGGESLSVFHQCCLKGGGPTPTIQNVINYIFIRTPVHKCNLLHFLWGVSVKSHGFWCSKMFDDAAESGWNPEHAWTIVKWRWLGGRSEYNFWAGVGAKANPTQGSKTHVWWEHPWSLFWDLLSLWGWKA